MTDLDARPLPAGSPAQAPQHAPIRATGQSARLHAMFEREFAFVWRMLRRLGVAQASIDDCAQQVFVVATRKVDTIAPDRERAFLLGVAINIAAEARRSQAIAREQPHDGLDEVAHGAPNPEQLSDRKRALELLDRALQDLPLDLRTVFVLFEVEGTSTDDIASLLDIPRGTVASRLRRAREEFHAIAKRLRARGR
jgi:RNA polymerase sigma-70 factor (ECF subfamily)